MKNKNLSTILVSLLSIVIFSQESKNNDENYIINFAETAVQEMKLYKIPASITLGQGLLETANGQSELAQNANNHFGIKCKAEWTGKTYTYSDDRPNECFRKYDSPYESYRDHSKFLAERPFYKNLFKLDIYDYKAWSHGLKKAGYATNPKYAQILIKRIEDYKLYEFDKLEPNEVNAKLKELYPDNYRILSENYYEDKVPVPPAPLKEIKNTKEEKKPILNAPENRIHPLERIELHPLKLKYIKIQEGETLYKISKTYKVSVDRLKKYNDIDNPNKIKTNQIIFLQNKKGKGKTKLYKVKEGDTLYSISQEEGIQIKKLLSRNRIDINSKIKTGDLLYLKGKKKK